MRENQKILFRGEGDQQPEVEPGDVVIILQQKPHEKFQRSGDDLYMNHTVTLTEALCGFSFMLRQLDGRELLVTHPPGQVRKKCNLKNVYVTYATQPYFIVFLFLLSAFLIQNDVRAEILTCKLGV